MRMSASTGGVQAAAFPPAARLRARPPLPPHIAPELRSPGQPLRPDVRAFMEPRFGHDFSQVRVHDDASAAASAKSLNAKAYTVGQHIVLGGAAAQTAGGPFGKLLAHELSHVVQQRTHASLFRSPIILRQVAGVDPQADSEDAVLSDIAAASIGNAAFGLSPTDAIWRRLDPLWMVGLLHVLERAGRLGYLKALDDHVGQAEGIFKERLRLAVDAVKLKLAQGTVTVMDATFEARLKIIPEQQQREIFEYMTGSKQGAVAITDSKTTRQAGAPQLQDFLHPATRSPGVAQSEAERIARMSTGDRLAEAVKRVGNSLKPELRARVAELLTPEAIGMMVAFTAIYVASQLTPAGWVADIIAGGLLVVSVLMIGSEIVTVVQNIADFARIAANAQTDADFDTAAQHLAFAITKIGVDVVLAILLHKAGKAAKPYLKPPPSSGAVVDMVTPDGQVVRVPLESVPESGLKTEQSGTQTSGGGEAPPLSINRPANPGTPIVETVSSDLPSGSYLPYEGPSARAVGSGSPVLSLDPALRPLKAQGWMFEDAASRTSAQRQMTGPGSAHQGMQAGHLLPAARGGPGQISWLVPLEEHVNKSQIASIEAFIKARMDAGSSVYLQVFVRYLGEGKIPEELTYYVYELVDGALKLSEKRMVGGEAPVFVH